MRAWLLDRIEGLSALRLADDAPDPAPASGQVVLQLSHAALNPADRYLAENQYPVKATPPHVLGRDGIGKVIAVGRDVTNIQVGDERLILCGETGVQRWGTLAERVAVCAGDLVERPAAWTVEQAAGAALTYVTAIDALTMWEPGGFSTTPSLAGKTVLVTGASGGVGVAAVQLAAAMGARVVALSRDAGKRQKLSEIGANVVVDANDHRWNHTLKDQLGGRKIDLAIDNIGGPAFNTMLDVLGDNGRVSVVGRLTGPVPQFNSSALLARRLRIGGVFKSALTREQSHAAWQIVVRTLAAAKAVPLVDHMFELRDALSAFDRLAAGPFGKVVIKIAV